MLEEEATESAGALIVLPYMTRNVPRRGVALIIGCSTALALIFMVFNHQLFMQAFNCHCLGAIQHG